MIRFRANAVGFLDDHEGCAVLAFAELASGNGASLEIQRAHEFDDEDRDLGMDTYCVVVDAHLTSYGGIESFTFEECTLVLQLSEDASRIVGSRRIEVEVPAGDVDGIDAVLPGLLAS